LKLWRWDLTASSVKLQVPVFLKVVYLNVIATVYAVSHDKASIVQALRAWHPVKVPFVVGSPY
jgi:hypothetical protein